MIPLDAIPAGEGKLGFTLRVPIGVVGAIAPFNFPLNLVVHKVGAGHRRRLPGGAQAGQPDAVQQHRAGPDADRGVRPARRSTCTSSPAAAARSATPSSTTPTSRSSPSPARPRSAGASVPGRRASGSASSWATTPRASSSPTATGRPRPPRSRWPASATPGRAASRTQRVLRAPLDRRRVHRGAGRPRQHARGRRPDGRGHRRVGADLARASATGWPRGWPRPRPPAPRSPPAARSTTTACCARR